MGSRSRPAAANRQGVEVGWVLPDPPGLLLPGFERKVRVALDWTLDLFFPRDIIYLRAFMKPAVPQETPHEGPVPDRARKTS